MADSLLNYIFLNLYKTGIVAEWLGSGLQHHLQQFESARYLKKYARYFKRAYFIYICLLV